MNNLSASFFKYPSAFPPSPLAAFSHHRSFSIPAAKHQSWVSPILYHIGGSLFIFSVFALVFWIICFSWFILSFFWNSFFSYFLIKVEWEENLFFNLHILFKLGWVWCFGCKLFSLRFLKMFYYFPSSTFSLWSPMLF